MVKNKGLTGGLLREARIEAGFRTAKDFYEKFKIKSSTYSAHESGRNPLSVKTAKKYAKYLKILPKQLLIGSDEYHDQNLEKYVLHFGQVPRDILLNKMLNEPTIKFIKSAGIQKGMKVAEFGCGTGSMACWLAEFVGSEGSVYAIDKGYEQILTTKRRAAELNINNIECIRTEIKEESLNIKVDLIYMRCFLHHVQCPEKIIQIAMDSLSKDGILICMEPIMSSFWTYPNIPEIQKALDLYMKLGKINNLDFDIGKKLQHYLFKTNEFNDFQASVYHNVGITKIDKSWIEMITSECAPKYIEEKLCADDEMDILLAKITEHLNNENTIATSPAFVCVAAKKK